VGSLLSTGCFFGGAEAACMAEIRSSEVLSPTAGGVGRVLLQAKNRLGKH
jgi:hypothetical protein